MIERRRGAYLALTAAALVAGATGLARARPSPPAGTAGELVYFGTHGSGPGQGVFAARFDEATGVLAPLGLAAEIERPTWIVPAARRGLLYAVSETGNDGKSQGGVYALAADPATGHLRTASRQPSGGGGATHLGLDARSRTLFVANYGTGQVAALPVEADGGLEPPASVQADQGSGPSPRQKAPHAHAAIPAPGGRFVLVPDLGADRVFVYRFDPATRALSPGDPPYAATTPGSGPRHGVFLPGGRLFFAIDELTGNVDGYRWNGRAGRLTPLRTTPGYPADYAGTRSGGEIAASADGRFLYTSDRGRDEIAVWGVGADGSLSPVQRIPAGGIGPWSFAVAPGGRWMLVANEASSGIAVFGVDRRSGRLTAHGGGLSVPRPTSVAFAPR